MIHSPQRFYRANDILPSLILIWLLALTGLCQEHYTLRRGELPVLIVSPHGGSNTLENAAERKKGDSDDPHFSTKKDLMTAELAQEYEAEFLRRTGRSPSILLSHIHRKYCDPNRPQEWSADGTVGRAFHGDFHKALQSEVDRLVERHGWVLLLDIHGQSAQPNDVIFGTRRATTTGQRSQQLLWSEGGVLDTLTAEGFDVIPKEPRAQVPYGGGYIVKTYGADPKVEAWQMEHGKEVRFDKARRGRLVELFVERLSQLPE